MGGGLILLDTHVWVWVATESDKLSRRAAGRIRNAGRIGVCTISYWEVAMLFSRGRVNLDRSLEEWLEQASSLPGIELIPLSPAIAVTIAELGEGMHGDPAGRIIAATALTHRAALITKDERMHEFKGLDCVW
jgi:PIN domain nuclease of toxin-antitoxin system